MKVKYTTPVMEVIEFEVEDIITESNNLMVDIVRPANPEENELPAIGIK